MHEEQQYLDLLDKIITDGNSKSDRTGVGTYSIFGHQMRFDLSENFPVLTTKKVYWRGVVEELLWMIRGDTDSKKLEEKKVNIWKGNTSREFLDKKGLYGYPEGCIGPGYGFQWRNFNGTFEHSKTLRTVEGELKEERKVNYENNGIDQLQNVFDAIENNPNDRRIIFSAWNPAQIDKMALPPCHMFAQFYVFEGRLSCQMYQRSCDTFLGVPFNISSYALLTCLLAKATGLKPGELVWVGGDVHIYKNHIEQVKEQLTRKPYPFPTLNIKKDLSSISDIENLSYEDIELIGYQSHDSIKAEMAV